MIYTRQSLLAVMMTSVIATTNLCGLQQSVQAWYNQSEATKPLFVLSQQEKNEWIYLKQTMQSCIADSKKAYKLPLLAHKAAKPAVACVAGIVGCIAIMKLIEKGGENNLIDYVGRYQAICFCSCLLAMHGLPYAAWLQSSVDSDVAKAALCLFLSTWSNHSAKVPAVIRTVLQPIYELYRQDVTLPSVSIDKAAECINGICALSEFCTSTSLLMYQ